MTEEKAYSSRLAERLAGMVSIVVAVLAVATILTSLDVTPDYSNIIEDAEYLGENLTRLSTNTHLWLANAILIILLGPLVLLSLIRHDRIIPVICAFTVSGTGIIYLLFSIYGFNLIELLEEFTDSTDQIRQYLAYSGMNAILIRQKLQLACFTTAGISAVLVGLYILLSKKLPAFTGGLIIFGGILYGIFGWFSTDNLFFSAGRLIFILSLMIIGSYLLLKGSVDSSL
jgi:hypothetical protein